ncbi:HugZ family protein [Aureimonas flava]|nr:DUF2470 domain-containing protein [Aureimonas flava]
MTDTPPAAATPYLVADEEARALARRLLRTTRHAALGWLDPTTGAPMASRVALAADFDASPILLLSQLSAHTRALAADPRLSLLAGEAGAGDPMNQPRLSIAGTASPPIGREAPEHERLSRRFTAHHPAASHYGQFADFAFFRVTVTSAFLNAGFARAYPLGADDVTDSVAPDVLAAERRVVDHMNEDHADVLDRLMARRGRAESGWRIATLDRRGFELVAGSLVDRLEFAEPVETGGAFRKAFVALAAGLDADAPETGR